MPTTDSTTQLIQMLDESGFPEDRKQFWISKMAQSDFSEADRKAFVDELKAHVETLDTAIAITEGEIAQKEAKIKELKMAALPHIKQVAQAQPALLEAEQAEYKKTVKTAENEMMTELKNVRTSQNTQEIEAIRKKLASG